MERTIFLDIETIPTQCPFRRAEIAASIKAPGNISKAETIAKWEAESKPDAVADAIARTSFDPALGHICTIAWAIDDGIVWRCDADEVEKEASMLANFFSHIDSQHRTTWAGHYISGFDLRFIICRAVVLGVKIPQCIPRDPKPWGTTVFDTMTAWSGSKGTISLDNLCKALGIEGKKDFDGSMIAEAWANGEHDKIAAYCSDDVEKVRAIWHKFQAAGF